jgi:site-specific DNA recombinase
MDDLEDVGVHFRSATEPFDTASAAGRLFVQMLGAFAEFEREVIIDRVIAGMERKAANGEWTHGPRPYGYLVDPVTHRLLPHPEERHVVSDIFTIYARARRGTRAIADQLNSQGVRTKHGKPFSGHTINAMLSNRLYLGETFFRDVVTVDAHQALIDPGTFEECQRILTARGEPGSSRAASNSGYCLTGLITCPECGCKYVGASATGKLRRYRYYTCFSRIRYGRSGCQAPRIDADLLDPAATTALVDFFARTDVITEAIANEHRLRAQDAAQHAAELDSLAGRAAATQAAIDRYLTAFENGTLDDITCGRRVTDLTAQLDQLNQRRAELTEAAIPQHAPDPAEIERIHRHLADILASGTLGQRKAVMETHIAKIQFDGNRLIPIYRIPADAFRALGQVVGWAGLEPATCGPSVGERFPHGHRSLFDQPSKSSAGGRNQRVAHGSWRGRQHQRGGGSAGPGKAPVRSRIPFRDRAGLPVAGRRRQGESYARSTTYALIRASAAFQLIVSSLVDHDWMSSM